MTKNGVKALDLTLDFDEMVVLEENRKYLATTLEVKLSFKNQNQVTETGLLVFQSSEMNSFL